MTSALDGARQLFLNKNRSNISGYPSAATPALKQAWETPQVKYYATVQPFVGPLSMWGGNVSLFGETAEMRREYREWPFREPSVKSAFLTKVMAICTLDAKWIPASKDKKDRAIARWMDYAFTRMAGGYVGLLWNILAPALIDGYSVNEKYNDQIDQPGSEYHRFWTPAKTQMIDTNYVKFKLDQYRQPIAIRPQTGMQGYVELPMEGFVLFQHLPMFANPFGISDFRAVVRDVRYLESLMHLRQIYLKNYTGPFLKASHPDQSVRRQLFNLLQDARARGFIVVPAGSEVEAIDLVTSAPEVFERAIQSYRESIVSGLQGSYLQLMTGGVSDERGDSDIHRNIAELFQWFLAMWLAEEIGRQMVPDYVYPNWGQDSGLPRFQLGGIDEKVIAQLLDKYSKAQRMGINLSLNQILSECQIESPEDAADTLPGVMPTAGNSGSGPGGSDPFGNLYGNSTPPQPMADRLIHVNKEGGVSGSSGPFRFWEPR